MIFGTFHTLLVLLSISVLCHSTGVYRFVKVPKMKKPDNSVQFRRYDELGNYAFGYETEHSSSTSFHREIGDARGNKAGTYGFTQADGRIRIVNYVADSQGFRASVQSNESGVSKTPHVPLELPVTLRLWHAKNLQYSF